MPDDNPVKRLRRLCPICAKPVEQAWRPFCSKRCGNVDLGRWLGGSYAIPGEPADISPGLEPDEAG